ncbi:uncharacterized protein LOC126249299 [Schistocerca nitens]|uniref:uncharacterized protein LOC126249299 n=1 Tax=Schistocerca nitens TaxID=7011 RepID=UPI0021193076|nr:uncharacterized protein LOC126249299 [Schistocerca nitens]
MTKSSSCSKQIKSNLLPFNIMYHNVQSLTNKLQDLEIILCSDLNVDVICITEHWLEDPQIETLKIPGFSLVSSFCRSYYKHGGIAIFAKQDLRYKAIQTYPELNKEKVFEMAAVELTDIQLVIITMYRSPDANTEEFQCKFDMMLSIVEPKKKKIIWGDFNIDFLKSSNYKDELLYMTKSFNLMPTENTQTRITRHSKTESDQIFIQENFSPYSSEAVKIGYSDHEAVLLSLELCSEKISPIKITECRDFSDSNIAKFCNILSRETWDEVFNETDVNRMFDNFHGSYEYYFDIVFTLKQHKLKPTRNKSWITKHIKISSARKRVLHSYKKQNNISSEMQNYIKEYSKIYYKVINDTKKKELYFGKAANDLIQSNFQNTNMHYIENYKSPMGVYVSQGDPQSELILAMSSLKYHIVEPLKHIVNHSFSTSTFPNRLKIAKVTHLHKKGATDNVNNSRPVAQLSGSSKIFEKLFYNKLLEFVNKNSLLSNHQHGFRQSSSTTTAVSSQIYNWHSSEWELQDALHQGHPVI